MTLTKKQWSALRDFVLQEGEFDDDNVAEFLGADDVSEMREVGLELRRRFPDDFGDVDEDAGAEVTEPRVIQYKLVNERNVLEDLELVADKGDKVILRRSVPRDLVQVVVKGELITVDLLHLRRVKPDDVLHGVTVARLIELAEIAKA